MAAVNPPAFLQNAGNTHTAEITRQLVNVLTVGTQNTNSLKTRGGVQHQQGNAMFVQQATSPNMTVDVLSGNAIIPGTEDNNQGAYVVQNDATTNVAIAASDPSLPRIDLIVFKVQDQFYSGGANTSSIVSVTGTPAGSPTAPAAPANSLTLAQIAVAAGTTSITNANITDKRYFLAATGGIIVCGSGTRPPFTQLTQSGVFIFETDTQLMRRWDGATSSFIQVSPYVVTQKLGSPAVSITFSNIPTSMKRVRFDWTARGTNASANSVMCVRVNADSTSGHYFGNLHQTQNTTAFAPTPNPAGTDRFAVGTFSAASVGSNNYGTGRVEFFGWEAPHNWVGCNFQSHVYSDSAANSGTSYGGAQFIQNGPYTSVTFFPDAGNFATNTEIRMEAWE